MDVRLFLNHPCNKRYVAGQGIDIAEGEKALHIVLFGLVADRPGSTSRPKIYGPGRTLNMRAFLYGDKSGDFVAAEDTLICALSDEAFDKMLAAHPQLYRDLLNEAYAGLDELENAERESKMYATMLKNMEPPAVSPKPVEVQAPPVAQAPVAPPKPVVTQAPVAPPKPVVAETAVKKPAAQSVLGWPQGFAPEGHKRYGNITHPEYKSLVYQKDYTCPNCKAKFKDYKVFQSKLVPKKAARYDSKQYYNDFQAEWYDVVVCPTCRMATLATVFAEPKGFIKAAVQDKLKALDGVVKLDFNAERDIDFVFTAHYLALLCADAFAQQRQLKAKLWSNLSWLYEDVEDDELATLAAGNAARANETIYMEVKLNPMQEQAVCMAIAGMLYRTGDKADIKKWLFKVKTNRSGKKVYVDRAEDLLDILREEG